MSNTNTNTTSPEENRIITPIEALKPGDWSVVEGKIIQLWDNEHPSIRQIGIIGDDTGIAKFVSWVKSDLPLVEVDVSYRFTNLVVSEHEGRVQVAFNSLTKITRLGSEQTTLDEVPTV